MLEPVHVLEMDRATTRMEVVRINPTRSFAKLGPSGIAVYTWQSGQWFDQGGQALAPENVPEEYRAAMAATPVTVTVRGPAVVATCDFCGERMNQSEKEAHLIAHLRNATGLTTLPPLDHPSTPPPEVPEAPTTTRPPRPKPASPS